MTLVIRAVAPRDKAAWLAMRMALWPDEAESHARDIAAYFAGQEPLLEQVWLAEREDEPVGFLELSLRPYAEGCEQSPVPYIEGWYVADSHRQQGVGRALVAHAEHWARAAGYSEMASDTEAHNALSVQAHQALGFEVAEQIICFRKTLAPRQPSTTGRRS